MGKVNNVWNHYFKDKRRFADLFNGICFQGRKVIFEEDLQDGSEVSNEAEVEKQEACKRGKRMERIRDIKMLNRQGGVLRMLAMENQNLVDYTMPFRCMQYDTAEYSQQLNALRSKNRDNSDYETDAEKLCGIKKADRILPVYTLCVYHGEENWDGPRTLKDMMDFGADEDGMSEHFADYPLHLICLNEIQDYGVFHTEIRKLFQILQYRKNKAGLKKLLQENSQYRKMDADTLEVLSVLLNAPRIWEDRMKYMDIEGEKEEYDMCQALREWIEEEREAGMEEGRIQGREEGRKEGRTEGRIEGRTIKYTP